MRLDLNFMKDIVVFISSFFFFQTFLSSFLLCGPSEETFIFFHKDAFRSEIMKMELNFNPNIDV
jgi:hypothetical protein